jgi:RNA polymerase sigma factor (sigma-70 family)
MAEAEDFASEFALHLVNTNYEALRRFQGRSRLGTYLMVVVQRYFLDYRNRLWGKWRPSAEARRLGPLAIRLERLVTREHWTFGDAAQSLKTHFGIVVEEEFPSLCLRIARRQPSRKTVSEVEADQLEDPSAAADVEVVRAEQHAQVGRLLVALDRVRRGLRAEERLILKMRFDDAVPIVDIARTLNLNQKRLYRDIEHLYAKLRAQLEAEGFSRQELDGVFASGVLSATHMAQDNDGDDSVLSTAATARTTWPQRS